MATQTAEQKAKAKAKKAEEAAAAEEARRALLSDEERAAEDAAKATSDKNEDAAGGKDSVTVDYPGGVRTFSKEVQGAAFKDNAKEFAEKHGGTIRK